MTDKFQDQSMCEVFIDQPVGAFETTFFRVTPNLSQENLVTEHALESPKDSIISNANTQVTLLDADKNSGELTLEIVDLNNRSPAQKVKFSIEAYKTEKSDRIKSGPYSFATTLEDSEPVYSIENIKKYQS